MASADGVGTSRLQLQFVGAVKLDFRSAHDATAIRRAEVDRRFARTIDRAPRRRRPTHRGGACSDTCSGCPSPGSLGRSPTLAAILSVVWAPGPSRSGYPTPDSRRSLPWAPERGAATARPGRWEVPGLMACHRIPSAKRPFAGWGHLTSAGPATASRALENRPAPWADMLIISLPLALGCRGGTPRLGFGR